MVYGVLCCFVINSAMVFNAEQSRVALLKITDQTNPRRRHSMLGYLRSIAFAQRRRLA
jgi:hypothetical protein